MHLIKTDKYLVKCQAVYCPYYVIKLSPVLGAMWSDVWKKKKKNVYEISPDIVASREIMAKESDSQSAKTWLAVRDFIIKAALIVFDLSLVKQFVCFDFCKLSY